MNITVGIPTSGTPVLEKRGDCTLLHNMLIGKDFHWQQSLAVMLPGEVRRNADPVFGLVNTLDIEDYLQCVVGSEMNPRAPLEFLKAHAVISRSWAVGKVLRLHNYGSHGKVHGPHRHVDWQDTDDHRGFDVCSDDHCQRYQGRQPVSPEGAQAIGSTAGIVLAGPSGTLVDARFSKCCGGLTELFSTCWQDTEPECLESFDDPWCDLSPLTEEELRRVAEVIFKDYDAATNGYRWECRVSPELIERNLHRLGYGHIGSVAGLEPLQRGPSGRIKLLRAVGTEGTVEIGKELAIRRLLSASHLYSSAFDVIGAEGGCFLLRGRGWGHGVGLCQTGAARMALCGHTWREILSFYYPGSTAVPLESLLQQSGKERR